MGISSNKTNNNKLIINNNLTNSNNINNDILNNTNNSINNNNNNINKIFKKVSFLIAQQNDIQNKNIMEEENIIGSTFEFYLINETIEEYKDIFDIEDYIKYLKDFYKITLNMSNLNEIINNNEIQNFVKIKDLQSDKKKNIFELNFKFSNDIQYPINFYIIEKQWFSTFLNIYKIKNKNIYEQNLYKGYMFKDYIILEFKKNKHEKDIDYLVVCSLKEMKFNVDFIILKETTKKIGNEHLLIKTINFLYNKLYDNNQKNKIIPLNDGFENIGSVICFPESNEFLSKIIKYYNLDYEYYNFLLLINEIENNELSSISIDEIEKILKKQANELWVYLVEKEKFDVILDRIYFNEYINYSHMKVNNKEKFINEIKEKELNNNKVDLNILIKTISFLSYNNFMDINNKKICLINEKFYECLFDSINSKDLNELRVCLLKINKEYFLYFKRDIKYIKIKKDEIGSNIWISNMIHDKNKDIEIQIKTKPNQTNDRSFSQEIINSKFDEKMATKKLNLIQKLLLIYYVRNRINKIINNEKIQYDEKYNLINKDWINQYKKHYKINDIIKKSNNINFDKPYEDYKLELLKDKDFNYNNFELSCKFPEELKNSGLLLPKNDSYSNYKYPTHFELIKADLLNLLIKEEDAIDSYEIKNPFENDEYNILFERKNIYLQSTKNNNILVYYFDNSVNKEYIIKYIFQYNNSTNSYEQMKKIEQIGGIEEYINFLKLDLSQNEQKIIENGENIIGEFINVDIKDEILTISSFKEPPLIGLVNIGATCYMNATLQCFANIDTLTNYFLTNKNNFKDIKKYDLVNEYLKLINNLWNIKIFSIDSNNRYYEPNDFKKRLGEKNPIFSGVSANDSKDLIMFIIEELHKELKEPNQNAINDQNITPQQFQFPDQTNEKVEYKRFSNDYYSKNKSIIQKIFYAELESITFCYNCKVQLYSFSIINFLIFPLEKIRQHLICNNSYRLGYVTLLDCFNHYVTPEIMTGPNRMYCNYCKTQSDFSTRNLIYKHPEVFIIILNRGKGLEFQVPFQYPESFILNNYINFNNNENYKMNEIIEYELISIIAHIGDNSMSGHFIACCKSPANHKWYRYNDAIVSECKNPLNIFGNNSTNSSIPYVLFYQIKKNNNELIPQINSNNQDKNTFGNDVTLYFLFSNEKELYLTFKENLKFEEIISLLIGKYELPKKQYIFERKNGNIIDASKTIKENGISNEETIFAK